MPVKVSLIKTAFFWREKRNFFAALRPERLFFALTRRSSSRKNNERQKVQQFSKPVSASGLA